MRRAEFKRFPPEPLLDLCRVDGELPDAPTLAFTFGVHKRSITRYLAGQRIPWLQADRMCAAYGIHPSLVWPNEWAELVEQWEIAYQKKLADTRARNRARRRGSEPPDDARAANE